tara:strand:- start:511 stop:612 length:102 start_codon:yes stop_codon:yes gene_type:complete
MIRWAAFFELQNEDMERDKQAAQRGAASRTQTR